MDIIEMEGYLRLRFPLQEEWKEALPWYENPKIMYYSEGVEDKIYSMEDINKMYGYLSKIGELYFIEILEDGKWKAIGDVTLSEENMPIVIGDEKYWGKGIGKIVVGALIERAKEIGIKRIEVPTIYHYNYRSQNLFKSMGFVEIDEDEKSKSFEIIL